MENKTLVMKSITKSFPGVLALHDVDFEVKPGEVVGLMGENGAGKSTLMKILTGVYQPDSGTITWGGKQVSFATTRQAQAAGISIIFQELNNCPNLKPLDNLFLGRELDRKNSPFLDLKMMQEKAAEVFKYLDVSVNMDTEVRNLSTAQQQMIEIAKALLTNASLLIMDEPTSSLSDREVTKLFSVITELKSRGISVIFISHKLDEVFEITDRIVVLRDGESMGELVTKNSTQKQLITKMVGREISNFYTQRTSKAADEVVFEAKNLSGPPYVEDVSFAVHKGEIVGLAGLIGAGRTETARLIIGAAKKTKGEILLDGKPVEIRSPEEAVAHGIAYLPEDRKVQSLILNMTVRDNLTMSIHKVLTNWFGIINRTQERQITDKYIKSLDIKLTNREQAISSLSGGNQQKVVIAKWLATVPRLLILDEPTRGIDVHAKSEVHRIIAELADSGVSIVFISSELPEILELSDRVVVMREGKVRTILDRKDATQETIMNAAFSGSANDVKETA
jgi:ABC-type sugar transport system ATPase subunit